MKLVRVGAKVQFVRHFTHYNEKFIGTVYYNQVKTFAKGKKTVSYGVVPNDRTCRKQQILAEDILKVF